MSVPSLATSALAASRPAAASVFALRAAAGLAVVLGAQVGLEGVVRVARGLEGIGGEHVGLGGLGIGESGIRGIDIRLGKLGGARGEHERKSKDGEKDLEVPHDENPPKNVGWGNPTRDTRMAREHARCSLLAYPPYLRAK
jgi:hypothetical protein